MVIWKNFQIIPGVSDNIGGVKLYLAGGRDFVALEECSALAFKDLDQRSGPGGAIRGSVLPLILQVLALQGKKQ